MKRYQSALLGRGGDQQIGILSTPLTSRGEKSLYLSGALDVLGSGLNQLEHRQVGHVLVPFPDIAAAVSDLEVGDARSTNPAGLFLGPRIEVELDVALPLGEPSVVRRVLQQGTKFGFEAAAIVAEQVRCAARG